MLTARTLAKALVAALCAVPFTVPAAPESPKRIEVPAGDLVTALESLSKQVNVNLVYQAEQMQGVKTQGVSGNLTPREAVVKLLKGTPLRLSTDETTGAMLISGPGSMSSSAATSGVSAQKFESALRLAHDGGAQSAVDGAGERAGAASSAGLQAQQTSAGGEVREADKLQEIVVTATKRAERIQDVAVSVSAIGADELESRGIAELSEILRSVPGVFQHDSDGFNSAIVIRGITQSVFYQNTGAGPTVSTYFDETPITFAGSARVGATEIRFSDLERVEVLRGPQGTTFGDASLSGAVRIIPAAPKLNEFLGNFGGEYSVTGGYGSDNNKIDGMLNIPLVQDKLALRASVYRHENSGFYKTVSGNHPESVALNTAFGSTAFAVDRDNQGANIYKGGRVAALWQATEDFSVELAFYRQEAEQNGLPWADTAPYENIHHSSHPDQRNSRGHAGEIADSQIQITSLKAQYGLGWGDFTSAVSWVESGVQWVYAAAAVFDLPWSWKGDGTGDSFTAEVRFASKLDGPVQFLAGLYHEKLEADHHEIVYHLGTPETNFFYAEPLVEDEFYRDNRDQNAVFGEISYDLTERLRLTAGGRYYEYDRTNEVVLKGGIFGFPSPDAGDGGNIYSTKRSGSNFKADISFRPNDDTLLYALWSQGFRLGRPQTGVPEAVCDVNGDGFVDGSGVTVQSTKYLNSDSLDNLELGAKSSLFNERVTVSAAAFRDVWTEIPTLVHFGLDGGAASEACIADINIGEAIAKGVEFQANMLVTRAFRVDLGAAYVHATYSKDAPGIGVRRGDRLPNSPRLNWNVSAQYGFQLRGYPSYVRMDSHYAGSFISNFAGLPRGGGYYNVDASLGMTIGNTELALFANNLTDVEEVLYPLFGSVDAGMYTRPRTVGFRLKYNF